MNRVSKILTGAAAAALVTVGAAAPAEAQYRYRDRDRGIDVGDVIAGVAIVGGIAAIAGAVSNSNRRGYDYGYGRYDRGYAYNGGYGHNGGYGYNDGRYGEGAAIGACSYQAQRYGQGRVSVTDIDRRGRSFRVRGVIDNYGGGYDRYDRRGGDRIGFTCTARDDGRVTDFDTNRYY